MSEHRPEVADVIRNYGAAYLERYRPSKEQRRVLRDLAECRTAALGGHLKKCDRCGHEVPVYNSCRNRHCPKCEGAARAAWLEARQQELLDVEYFHVVFTVPNELSAVGLQNRRAVYGILFRAASETLLSLARDPKHLGAEIGFVAVLHTWGQNLHHHPHLHCVVTGGGLGPDGEHWVSCRDGFFLPLRVLSRLFRGKFLAYLHRAFEHQDLSFHGRVRDLEHPKLWESWLESLRNKEWVVYSKPPFGGPGHVLKYLARYTHRVAISNQRLLPVADGKVSFHWKDYVQGNRQRKMTLSAVEFLRRFLLHVLPSGFMRVRYYGFLANRHRAKKLQYAKRLLTDPTKEPENETSAPGGEPADQTDICPRCTKGRLLVIARVGRPLRNLQEPWTFDSS